MFKFIARLFGSRPIADERVSKCEEWLLLKLVAEHSGNLEQLDAICAAAEQGFGRMVEKHGRESMLYLTYEGLETYCGLCLDAFHAMERATLRPDGEHDRALNGS